MRKEIDEKELLLEKKKKAKVSLLFNLKAVRRWVGCFDRSRPPVDNTKRRFLKLE